jgi:hypothetical protein
MSVIRGIARQWLERQVRAGLLPASLGAELDGLAAAVHDQLAHDGFVVAKLYNGPHPVLTGRVAQVVEDAEVEGVDRALVVIVWLKPPRKRTVSRRSFLR